MRAIGTEMMHKRATNGLPNKQTNKRLFDNDNGSIWDERERKKRRFTYASSNLADSSIALQSNNNNQKKKKKK